MIILGKGDRQLDNGTYVRLGQSKRAKVVYRSSDLAAWLDARVHEDTSKEGTAA